MKKVLIVASPRKVEAVFKALNERADRLNESVNVIAAHTVSAARQKMAVHPDLHAAVIDSTVPYESNKRSSAATITTLMLISDIAKRNVGLIITIATAPNHRRDMMGKGCTFAAELPDNVARAILPTIPNT